MDFNCIYHLIAYRKDKPDILVKEALDLLLSVGKTPEQAKDTLTGILSVGAGSGSNKKLPLGNERGVMAMNIMEVLTLLLLIFTVLSYLKDNQDHDSHNKKK